MDLSVYPLCLIINAHQDMLFLSVGINGMDYKRINLYNKDTVRQADRLTYLEK